MKSNKQQGLTIVEGLLALVIVAIIAVVGWYVYHSRNSANSAYNSAAKTSAANSVSPSYTSKDKDTGPVTPTPAAR